ncbi:DMT family transporter [Gilvimarinus sp. F26214L]|uniref:DMT family transporter n=1 Tax=Gilvimarinus sp. DZF01 TaxID=3461371 RepID=UPI0040462ACE
MGHITPRLLGAALLAVLSMSLVPLLIRSTQANEITIGLVRILVAVLALSPVVIPRQGLRGLGRREWMGLAVVGFVFGCHWLSYFLSIKMSSASIAAISICTYGIHLLLLNFFIKGHHIRPAEWLAVVVCFLGVVLIAPSFDLRNQVTLGMLMGVFSGFLYACLPLLHQRIMHVPTMSRAWGQFAFAALVFVPLAGYSEWDLQLADWWRLLVLGLVCTVLGHTLWVKASSELPPVVTGVSYYLYVPIAMVGSFALLDEAITPSMVLGAGLIIAANVSIALLAWQRSRRAVSP